MLPATIHVPIQLQKPNNTAVTCPIVLAHAVHSSLHTTQNGVDWEGHAPKNCIEDEGLDRGKLLQRDHPLPTWPTGILQDRQLHYFRAPRRTEARHKTLKKFKKATMVTLLSRDHSYDRLNLLLRQQTQPPED